MFVSCSKNQSLQKENNNNNNNNFNNCNNFISNYILDSIFISFKEVDLINKKFDNKRENYKNSFNLWLSNNKELLFQELKQNKKLLLLQNYSVDINKLENTNMFDDCIKDNLDLSKKISEKLNNYSNIFNVKRLSMYNFDDNTDLTNKKER